MRQIYIYFLILSPLSSYRYDVLTILSSIASAIVAFFARTSYQLSTGYGPHIDNKRIFTDYDFRNKYPFGTMHYIIAQLEEDGVSIKLPDLYSKVPNSNIQF